MQDGSQIAMLDVVRKDPWNPLRQVPRLHHVRREKCAESDDVIAGPSHVVPERPSAHRMRTRHEQRHLEYSGENATRAPEADTLTIARGEQRQVGLRYPEVVRFLATTPYYGRPDTTSTNADASRELPAAEDHGDCDVDSREHFEGTDLAPRLHRGLQDVAQASTLPRARPHMQTKGARPLLPRLPDPARRRLGEAGHGATTREHDYAQNTRRDSAHRRRRHCRSRLIIFYRPLPAASRRHERATNDNRRRRRRGTRATHPCRRDGAGRVATARMGLLGVERREHVDGHRRWQAGDDLWPRWLLWPSIGRRRSRAPVTSSLAEGRGLRCGHARDGKGRHGHARLQARLSVRRTA